MRKYNPTTKEERRALIEAAVNNPEKSMTELALAAGRTNSTYNGLLDGLYPGMHAHGVIQALRGKLITIDEVCTAVEKNRRQGNGTVSRKALENRLSDLERKVAFMEEQISDLTGCR